MKKLFLSVAILAVAASCSKNEVTDVAPSSLSSEIGFSTLNNRVTKAATSNNDDYQVFAVSTDTSLEDFYIDEVLDGSTDVINSGDKYYWPVDYTLDFYAYAPSTIATSAASVSDAAVGTITIADYAVPGDVDFTVATPIVKGTQSNTVDLKFNHILSKVTVEVALSTALVDAGYELSTYAATLGVAASTGTVNVMATTPAITAASTAVPATYSGTTSYMILPQTAAGTTITITDLTLVSASTGSVAGGVEDVTLAPYTISSNDMSTGFVANTHYTITITIDGTSDNDKYVDIISPIEFTSEINASWTATGSATIVAVDGPTIETTTYEELVASANYDEGVTTTEVFTSYSGYGIYTNSDCTTQADSETYADEITAINTSIGGTNGISTNESTTLDITSATESGAADITVNQYYTVTSYIIGGTTFYVKTYGEYYYTVE